MPLFDSHCHLSFEAFDVDRNELIDQMRAAQVQAVVVGTNAVTSRAALELAVQHPDILRASVGLHPNETEEGLDLQELDAIARHPMCVAIGECGLDLYRTEEAEKETVLKQQTARFLAQAELATARNLPLIIHCRETHVQQHKLLVQLIREAQIPRGGVIHCFTGTLDEAQQYLDLGFHLSFTGILTFIPKSGGESPLMAVARALPLEQILIETDAPYLAPEPVRGTRATPLHVRAVCEKLAELHGRSTEEVEAMTTENARRLFGWR